MAQYPDIWTQYPRRGYAASTAELSFSRIRIRNSNAPTKRMVGHRRGDTRACANFLPVVRHAVNATSNVRSIRPQSRNYLVAITGVKVGDAEKCKYCTERKKPCIRANAFRFRPVKAVKFNAGEYIGSAEQSLEFRIGQKWVEIPRSCTYKTGCYELLD